MRIGGKRARVIAAVLSGSCNTSQDVADETGMSVRESSKIVSALIDLGVLRDTGRRIPSSYPKRKFTVFEVVT